MSSRTSWSCLGIMGLLALVTARPGAARNPMYQDQAASERRAAASNAREADAKAIRAVNESFVKSYNGKDAAALGALFTDAAEIEDEDGEIIQGRESIVERYTALFAENAGGTLSVEEESLKFLGANLAVETGLATIKPSDGGPARSTRYTVLHEKSGERWLQARVQDEAVEEITPAERLKELDWMIGDWVNESENGLVTTICKRSPDGNFLLREFDVKIEGGLALSGVQRIGWDPLHKQFRTWIFDSEGGFGEGLIATDGENRWVVKVTGVRADGRSVTATTHLTRLGKDRVSWESTDRTLGGLAASEGDHFILVRRAPSPSK